MSSDKIKVAVRVRPFNRREKELGTECVIEMSQCQTILQPLEPEKLERKPPKLFAFDHCFYSLDPSLPEFASQEKVFDALGRDILDNAFQGYNACIFAYGQTGSGKSYTMMGSQDNKGIIPRLCDTLFDLIAKQQSPELCYKVEVSYMEIYNEKVHDLLDPKANKQSLKVREHNVMGPYVDGLSQLAVTSFEEIDNLMAEGNKSRTVAATNMNSESSRSHAVFSVILTQTLIDIRSGVEGEKVARLSLVDLAGSERAVKTGAVGERLKEGSNINKSLTTLGLVISKLADATSNSKNKDKFVPYRDSVLTWLLKDNLGGNSKTVMVATVSPSADNYEETLSTLRYADRAKRIVNHAVVNEDPNARIIRELRQEVEALKEMLKSAGVSDLPTQHGSQILKKEDLHEKLSESEKLMKEMSQTWEEKLEKTERLQHERQEALESMGISVQASGIKVEKNKYYLVNLNADPSLNELLVYYLKDVTLIGSSDKNDIQLSGLGIQPEHCIISIQDPSLLIEPLQGARCFLNGVPITEKTRIQHGDRIMWGNHHFFKVNCPRTAGVGSEPQTPAQTFDYNFAREELMLNRLSNDPIQTAIAQIERQHEEDKQVALEKQRQEYERQFQHLRNILSPSTPYSPYVPFDPFRLGKMTPCTPTSQMRVEKWAQERDEMFRRSLGQLKEDIVRANAFVQEANFLAEVMGRQTKFSVTLQIPPANLSPNRRKGAFVSEPAILVKKKGLQSQVWSMEKLENKLIDMRELYDEIKDRPDVEIDEDMDPFYETQETHNLIGVGSIFLEVLFSDVTLDYSTPVISQQGEVAGRLQVELSRTGGSFPQDRMCEAASEHSGDSGSSHTSEDYDHNNNTITVRVSIKQASGLPLSFSHFVFCQYSFWGCSDTIVVPPVANTSDQQPGDRVFEFNHTSEFCVPLSEEFIEHCAEGALSIEVWGHRGPGPKAEEGIPGWQVEQQQLAKARSLVDRWSELTRKIELWVDILELNDAGEYTPVEVTPTRPPDMLTGGTYQLRQGQQRRIQVLVRPVSNSGTLPIICEAVGSIAVGSVCLRSRLQKPLDSYQEEDLAVLREKWSDALVRRRQYLDQQIQRLINKQDKTEQDLEREQSLVEQWVNLTEERNAVLVPAPGSGIPGAPADWTSPSGMEPHIPVLFLDLNADDMSASGTGADLECGPPVAGLHSILPKEHGTKFYNLPLVRHLSQEVGAVATWDSSVHDSQHLNKITESTERVYMILKTTVRLSHPAPMDLVLRKRLSLNIFKRQSLTERIRKRISRSDWLTQTGVMYEVVSNIPKASEELEERESLAQIAASGEEASLSDGETYIEKYTRGVSAVEGILTLDRMRQSVAVKELLQNQTVPPVVVNNSMRKTASVPNFSQMLSSFESMGNVTRSESVADLNAELSMLTFGGARTPRTSDPVDLSSKSFGIARPTFLNLNLNLNSIQRSSKPSPISSKLGYRMETLHEEKPRGEARLSSHTEEEEDEEEEDEEPVICNSTVSKPLSLSRTLDSLSDFNTAKVTTPSTFSSGYGSEAVSSSNLTNDDTSSIKSINDDTPDPNTTRPLSASQSFDKTVPQDKSVPAVEAAAKLQSVDTDAPKAQPLETTKTQSVDRELSKSQSANKETFKPHVDVLDKDVNKLAPAKEEVKVVTPTPIRRDRRQSSSELPPETFNTLAFTDTNNDKTSISSKGNEPVHSKSNDKTGKLSKATIAFNTHEKKHETGHHSRSEERQNPFNKNFTMSNHHVSEKHGRDTNEAPGPGRDTFEETSDLPRVTVTEEEFKSQHDTMKSSLSSSLTISSEMASSLTVSSEMDSCSSDLDKRSSSSSLSSHDENKVVRRRSSSRRSSTSRASYPMGVGEQYDDVTLPEWVCQGESVLIRPYNTSGVIAYIGPTEFAAGTWIGVELDTATGKNDGTVQGTRYFESRPKHGIFVRADKLIQDRRGRAMRTGNNGMRRSSSRGEGLNRSRSRSEGLCSVGTRSSNGRTVK
uniref:Kinesin-like protein KIF13A n=1 Tax=Cacopsylla melanoneura TaxID=428564 RepID=A0A8D8LMB0_9HEMI